MFRNFDDITELVLFMWWKFKEYVIPIHAFGEVYNVSLWDFIVGSLVIGVVGAVLMDFYYKLTIGD